MTSPTSAHGVSTPSTARADTPPEGAREQIVKAARACFLRFGTGKTSMSDVANEADLSRGTVYRYFKDRAELIEGVFAYESHLFHEEMRKQLDRLDSLEDQIVECAGVLAAFEHDVATGARRRIEVSRERLALLLTTHSGPLLRDTIDFLVPYVEAARERGEIRSDVNARRASEWIGRMLFTISSMPSVTFRGTDPKAWQKFFREHVIRGLAS
jgi:AcrR family transcriptional regulator